MARLGDLNYHPVAADRTDYPSNVLVTCPGELWRDKRPRRANRVRGRSSSIMTSTDIAIYIHNTLHIGVKILNAALLNAFSLTESEYERPYTFVQKTFCFL